MDIMVPYLLSKCLYLYRIKIIHGFVPYLENLFHSLCDSSFASTVDKRDRGKLSPCLVRNYY